MKIIIETIPHDQQRYPTCGDWVIRGDGALHIRVSELGDDRMELLVGIHELIEAVKCQHDGVLTEAVDAFDIEFEKRRQEGDVAEPGDHPMAPYKRQHCIATGFERILAALLEVDWADYENRINALP